MRAAYLFLPLLLLIAISNASPPPPDQSAPTKIDITQHSEPHDAWDKLTSLAQSVAWPLTVVLALCLFRNSIRKIVEHIGSSGGEISIAGLGIKLPFAQRASVDDDVLLFKSADPITITNDSAKTTLLKMLRDPGTREYVVINLGAGKEWISSRLFIFALMLQRMKAIRAIVFLDGSVPKFLGVANPDTVRWALAQDQPWLEQAYLNAYASSIFYMPGASFVVSKYGALDPQVAENVVRNFLQNVRANAPAGAIPGPVFPPETREWVVLGSSTEYGTWLTGAELQKLIGDGFHKETIVASSDRKTEAKFLLQCTTQYVARVNNNGEFLSLVDRGAFVDELTSKLVSRLELWRPSKGEST
jgi:hypothetical protein